MGGTDAYANFENSSTNPRLQVRGTDLNGSCQAWIRATADAGAPKLFLANTRNTSGNSHTIVQNGDELGGIFFTGSDGSQFVNGASITAIVDGTPGADDMPGALIFGTTSDGGATTTERMRLDRHGNLCFGETAEPAAGSDGIRLETNGTFKQSCTGTGERNVFEFKNANGNVGKIVTQNSNTTYSTSSDYRLKENVVAMSDGITRLKQLKPSKFNFIGKEDLTLDGFLAHEIQSIVPEAVSGQKDDVKEDGSIDPQSVDYGRITPLLTAALQEAITEIESLKARLDSAGL